MSRRGASELAARSWNALIASLVIVAMGVQLWIAIRAAAHPAGHAVGTVAGAPTPTRIVRVLSFFTVQSNILCAITSAQLAMNARRDGPNWRVVRLTALMGILVTGVVYSTVLAKVHEPRGWQQTFTNDVFHYAVPVATVVGWLVFGPRPRIDGRTLRLIVVWPLAWVGYTVIHGAVTDWYPYPFVDVASHGYARAAANGALCILLMALIASLFWLGDRVLASGRD